MFGTRLMSGIILVITALVTICLGDYVLFATTAIISFIGIRELYQVRKIHNNLPGVVGYAGVLVYYAFLLLNQPEYIMAVLLGILVLFMVAYVFSFPKYKAEDITLGYFGIIYVAVMLSYIYKTRMLTDGAFLVWLIFICSWGSDTCAYCVGMLFGKHKMAPKLSPKKSIEGAVGGIVGAGILGAVYAAVLHYFGYLGNPQMVSFAVICGVGACISMIGDLAASAIKRDYNIKDYGTLIPGHGGILDRFDSVIFTAPIIYYLAIFFI